MYIIKSDLAWGHNTFLKFPAFFPLVLGETWKIFVLDSLSLVVWIDRLFYPWNYYAAPETTIKILKGNFTFLIEKMNNPEWKT